MSAAAHQAIKVRTLALDVHDPRHPAFEDESLVEKSEFLAPFEKYCESRNVNVVRDLEAAPKEVRNLLEVHHLRPMIMKYLYSGKVARDLVNAEPATVYADE